MEWDTLVDINRKILFLKVGMVAVLIIILSFGIITGLNINKNRKAEYSEMLTNSGVILGTYHSVACINNWVVLYPTHKTVLYLRDKEFKPIPCQN